jgi:hypothetical protein
MSVVTNVVFKTSVGDKRRIAQLNAEFQLGKKFSSCDDESLESGWYAGNKHLKCEIYPGAFQGLKLTDLSIRSGGLNGMTLQAYSSLFKSRKRNA